MGPDLLNILFCVNSCAVGDGGANGAVFDDCQNIVKEIFADRDFCQENNILAVNSINVARVLAQMTYYVFTAFEKMKETNNLYFATDIVFCVPTGNFGDILAGYWARKYFPVGAINKNLSTVTPKADWPLKICGSVMPNSKTYKERMLNAKKLNSSNDSSSCLAGATDTCFSMLNLKKPEILTKILGDSSKSENSIKNEINSSEKDPSIAYFPENISWPLNWDLVIASNSNDILTRFFESGAYELKTCVPTLSPSMDIQISSNFERFLYDLFEENPDRVRELLTKLKSSEKKFAISEAELSLAREYFRGYRVSEKETTACIKRVFAEDNYFFCPHSAVGYEALVKDIKKENRANASNANSTSEIVLATAHYGKFVNALYAHIENSLSDSNKKAMGGKGGLARMKDVRESAKQLLSKIDEKSPDAANLRYLFELAKLMPAELANLEESESAYQSKRMHLKNSAEEVRNHILDIKARDIMTESMMRGGR